MTDRTVSVRLRADASQYDAAMSRSSRATAGLERQVMSTEKATSASFSNMAQSGTRHLGRLIAVYGGLTLGAEGLARAIKDSISNASTFAQRMELIATQAGASQTEVNRLSKAVLLLSPKLGVGPTELADGLYHVESAGFRGAAALDIMTAAAKASKIGMSGMEETTQALIGTMAVGLKDVHSASDAIAFLNKIVGTGDMRMSKLAQSIATGVLPTFKSAGLGMIDFGAALATLTDNVTPADEAATRLRMTIALMSAPSAPAVKALNSIGLSSTALASDMRKPNGLLIAVEDLKKHLEASYPASAKLKMSLDAQKRAVKNYGQSLTDAGIPAKQQAPLLAAYRKELQRTGSAAVMQQQVLEKAFGGGKTSGAILTLLEELPRLQQKYKDIGTEQQRAAGLADAWAKTQQTAAQHTADFHAAVETLSVQFGAMLLPDVTKVTTYLSSQTIPAISTFLTQMQTGKGPGGDFARTLGQIGDDARQAWDDVQPLFHFVADHPDLFKEIAKDAALFAVALKGIHTIQRLPGVSKLIGGGVVGKAAGALAERGSSPMNPLFVYDIAGRDAGAIAKDFEKILGGKAATSFLGRILPAFKGPVGGVASVLIASGDSRQKGGYGGATPDDQVKNAMARAFAAFATGADHSGAFVKYSSTGSAIAKGGSLYNTARGTAAVAAYQKAFNGGNINKALAINWLLAYGGGTAEARKLLRQLGFAVPDTGRLPSRSDALADNPQALKHFQDRAAADTASRLRDNQAQADKLQQALTGGVLQPLDQAKTKADALSRALDEMFRPRMLQLQMASGQLSLRAAETALGIPHGDTKTPGVPSQPTRVSTPATRDPGMRAGLHIAGNVIVQQLPGESTSGSFVRGLEHAAFLAVGTR